MLYFNIQIIESEGLEYKIYFHYDTRIFIESFFRFLQFGNVFHGTSSKQTTKSEFKFSQSSVKRVIFLVKNERYFFFKKLNPSISKIDLEISFIKRKS